jgi:hypothetical protein
MTPIRRPGPEPLRGSLLGLALCLALLTLAACNKPGPAPTRGVEVLPTATQTLQPTFTPEPSSTPTDEPTTVPTKTPLPPTPTVLPTVTPTPTPTVAENTSPLTGLLVDDRALLNRRVLAFRIGNDPNIRPQEGLGLADVVYEEIMDGWTVTRFTALFQESSAERVRPLRSARLSSLAIAPQYDAALVHTGASDRIRWLLSQAHFVNLDQFFVPQPFGVLEGYDWRGRMYSSVTAVHGYLQKQGLERDKPINGYTFASQVPAGQPAVSINIPYPASSRVAWQYEAATGRYLRSVEGQPHLEALTQKQIAAQNVIIFYAEHKATDIVEDTNGATAIDIVMSGSGRAQVCRDGVVVECQWVQKAPGELIQYYDNAGKLIPLKAGKTWIQLVPTDYKVSIQ